jgi:prepilin-type N-terminal cleavage/methylation domain-containing protein
VIGTRATSLRADGFTMLEMLIAIAITALLVATAVRAYQGITRAQEHAGGGLDRTRAADVVLDRLERELAGAFVIVQPPGEDPLAQRYLFVALDRQTTAGDGDALRFITLSPARVPGAPTLVGPRMVTYAAIPHEDVGFALVRREEPIPEGLSRELTVEDGQVVLEDLAYFSVEYASETGEVLATWDSTQLAQLDQLPTDVNVELSLLAPDEEGVLGPGEARGRSISLPVRPIDFAELRAAAGAEGKQDCLTNAECLAASQTALEVAPDDKRATINALGAQTADECFDPSGQLASELRDAGVDVDATCNQ